MNSDPQGFPETRWSLVSLVGATTSDEQRQALGVLLQRYLPALRAHLVHKRRLAVDEADDLLQEFVSGKVLEQRLLERSDRERGRFRTFLLVTLDRFLIDQVRRRRVAERRLPSAPTGGDDEAMPHDPADDEARSDPFEAEWARQIIEQAVELMRAECDAARRPDLWGVFEERLLRPSRDGSEPLEYAELVRRFRLESPAQASNVLMTAKRMFARAVRAVVGQYADPAAVDAEIRDLRVIVGRE